MTNTRLAFRIGMFLVGYWAPAHAGVYGQELLTEKYFRNNCANCHTIGGGRRAGPDLKNVTKRVPSQNWVVDFISNPKEIIDSGDAYIADLVKEYRSEMPKAPGMNRTIAKALVELIRIESAKETSQFIGETISAKDFTPADVTRGRDLFVGRLLFKNGGAACASCHDTQGLRGFGGGQLGPDLTNVFEKKQFPDTNSLFSWLLAPGTPTMMPIYKDHPLTKNEVVGLVAFLEATSKKHVGTQSTGASNMNFFLIGLAGTVLGLILFDVIWKRRFRTVRRTLVEKVRAEKSATTSLT